MEIDPRIHPNALKHLDKESVLAAWRATQKFIRRESDDEPPRWLLIGWLPNGASVEMVAVELENNWMIIHALSPVQPKFSQEITRAEMRKEW